MVRVFYFYTVVIGLVLGIFTQSLYGVGFAGMLTILTVSLALALIWRKRCRASFAPYVLTASIFFLCFVLGVIRFSFSESAIESQSLDQFLDERTILQGVVIREPEQSESTLRIIVETEHGKILVRTNRYADIVYGDMLSFEGKVERPQSFETEFGRSFDYPGYLKAKGVTHTVSFADIKVIESGKGNQIVNGLLSLKQSLIFSFNSVIPEPQAGLGAGLLLGVKQALGHDLETIFRKTGIIHIVVLSGYNVMIVAEAIMRLLAVFLSLRKRVIVGVLAIVGFAVMVGLTATVVRASIMAILVLIASATGRTYLVMRALVLAGLIMLFINPYLLVFDPGFQLSFLATLGLILIAPIVEKHLSFAPTKFQVREFITATISTQIFILPFLLYLIGEFSVVAVVVNVLVLPAVPVAMGLVFLTGVVGLISTTLATLIGLVAYIPLTYIVGVAEKFSQLPFASFIVPTFPFWVVLFCYVGLTFFVVKFWRESFGVGAKRNVLEGWTIVEEHELTGEVSKNTSPVSDTPIFFK